MTTRGSYAVLSEYIDLVAGAGTKHVTIANHVNEKVEGMKLAGPLVGRWRRVEIEASAGNIAAFAQAYGRNPVEAFVAAGLLSIEDTRGALDQDSLELLAKLGIGDGGKQSARPRRTTG